jgi:hypothetical protein
MFRHSGIESLGVNLFEADSKELNAGKSLAKHPLKSRYDEVSNTSRQAGGFSDQFLLCGERVTYQLTRYREQLCFMSSGFFCKLPFCIRLDHDVDDR